MRTRRLVSLMVAVVAGIIWVLSTSANATNSWEPINFLLRIAAGTVTVAAAAEWLWLSLREGRDLDGDQAAAEDPAAKDRNVADLAAADQAVADRAVADQALDEGSAADDGQAPQDWAVNEDRPVDDGRAAHEERVLDPGVGEPRETALPAVRSAGSRTVLDLLLSLFGRRRRSANEDLAVVAGGGAVLVVAYLMERKVRRVSLRVGLDEASVQSLEAALGAAPHRVFGTETPTRGLFNRSAYTQVEGASRSGAWSISVPTEDVDTLRYALARADEIR
ncbi:hypothetical protein AB1046_20320 [Promicromonospora sp. Populi]|uniref:hypothetical protein n=1 Tax=Promicromonospora sp. Populi TaxID=3239420 RepID=UPI0034E279CD